MIRNVCRNTAVAGTANENTAVIAEKNTDPHTVIPNECMNDFLKAMKIGYYKQFYKQGLITADELDILLKMQDVPFGVSENKAA